MSIDITPLLTELASQDCDAYIIYDSAENCDMRYLSTFCASDPYLYICRRDGRETLIVAAMEELRATRESRCPVISRTSAGFTEYYQNGASADEATAKMIRAQCSCGTTPCRLMIPYSMPAGFAAELAKETAISIDTKNTVSGMRAVKTGDEIGLIRETQRENERGVREALNALRKSEIGTGNSLIFEDAPLTSERLKQIMHTVFYEHGLDDRDTIVSCGPDTALPHAKGEGIISAYQPIVMDVFPRGPAGYFADMTRTVSKGKPPEEICAMYKTVHEAKELAKRMIRPGVSGADVHNAVAEYFRTAGYETAGTSGFIHSLGHGVGLAIHESPSLSPRGELLVSGNVVTVEPGLYYPGIGGVRLEDMGVVTDTGFDTFTIFEEDLIIA